MVSSIQNYVVIKIFLVPVTRFGIQIKSRIIQIRAYNICNMKFDYYLESGLLTPPLRHLDLDREATHF